jgi:mycothiol synthase
VSFTLRAAAPSDAAAVAALFLAYESSYLDEPDRMSEHDVLGYWERLDEGDAVVVEEPGGRIVAAGTVRRRGDHLEADGVVHPDRLRLGIGALLLDWAESCVRGDEAVRVGVLAADTSARELAEGRGYAYVRSFYRMLIDLHGPPEAPQWDAGLEVRPMEPGEERLVYETLEDAFADHWGHTPRSFEEWSRGADIEPGLCFLAHAGNEGAAAAVCNEERFGLGWIGILGVRAPWRRRGLGRALLLHSFAALYERGRARIGLGVDAQNTTGAVALYERAGMRVGWQADVYERRR